MAALSIEEENAFILAAANDFFIAECRASIDGLLRVVEEQVSAAAGDPKQLTDLTDLKHEILLRRAELRLPVCN